MRNRLLISILLVTVSVSISFGQERIGRIRSEYYRINNSDNLNQVELSGHTYFIENNRVVKATINDSTGFSEYYYEFDNVYANYNLLFAFYDPAKSQLDLPNARYYFNDREEIVLYKENNEDASFFEADKFLKSVPLKAKNAINTFLNTFLNATDQYAGQKYKIDSIFSEIENNKLTQTNSPDEVYEEEGEYYNGGEKVFVNNDGNIVKRYHAESSHHGSKRIFKYYYDSDLILEIIELEYYINGFQYTLTKNYYTNEHFEDILFRKEIYQNHESRIKSTYGTDALLKFYLDDIVPTIGLRKKR